MNRIYKFGGIAGMAVGVLSLLALNGALPLKYGCRGLSY